MRDQGSCEGFRNVIQLAEKIAIPELPVHLGTGFMLPNLCDSLVQTSGSHAQEGARWSTQLTKVTRTHDPMSSHGAAATWRHGVWGSPPAHGPTFFCGEHIAEKHITHHNVNPALQKADVHLIPHVWKRSAKSGVARLVFLDQWFCVASLKISGWQGSVWTQPLGRTRLLVWTYHSLFCRRASGRYGCGASCWAGRHLCGGRGK